jgi:2',3'-cyclic-nucleotide 2'-phosphodiesterase (5'-nucleotidase family)
VAAAVKPRRAAEKTCDVKFEVSPGILPNRVVGTQTVDILRDPARLHESALGDLVADAMRERYADADVAFVNSGGLRADLVVSPPSASEWPGEITRGEMLMVLPFGNRIVILTVTGQQLEAALVNGFAPSCDPRFAAGPFRFPQLSGLKVAFHCDGVAPMVDGMWLTGEGAGGSEIPIGPTDPVRIVTLDYLLAGGDGYLILTAGTNVEQPGDTLLNVVIDYVAAHSPVGPVVGGRILGP